MRKILVLAVVALALIGAAVFWIRGGGASRDVDIVVPQGASLTRTSVILEDAGAVPSARAFVRYAKVFGGGTSVKPGEYRITKGMGPDDILALLKSGKTIQRIVTIPEGTASILVYERLMAAPLLSGEISVPIEGSILPDSYAYTRGEARSAVLARMQKAMQRALAKAWAARKPTAAVSSPEQALVLASIIEKETGRADERKMVGAVYTNRLKQGIMLQADPTFLYPITKGKPLGRRATNTDKAIDSPYNTYRYKGLPPGPITNPGQASIEAALDPANSNAIFFVAQPDGSSAFAETNAEHEANVAKWRAYRAETGK